MAIDDRHAGGGQFLADIGNAVSEAAAVAFRELIGVEVVPIEHLRSSTPDVFGERSAVLDLFFHRGPGLMLLSVTADTAAAIAGRMLAGQGVTVDDTLANDCLGEVANVIVGQGKATLSGTDRHYTFGTPRFTAGHDRTGTFGTNAEWSVLKFQSEIGTVVVQFAVVTTAGEAIPEPGPSPRRSTRRVG